MIPEATDERNSYIIGAVTGRTATLPSWSRLDSSAGGHTAILWIWQDALVVDGVRVGVSARLAQQIADALDAVLPTSKLADLLYVQRGTMLSPHPQPAATMATTAAMVSHSGLIDAELESLSAPVAPYSTVGKHWILSQNATRDRAVNYGWHVPSSQWSNARNQEEWAGIKVFACASLAKDAKGSVPRVIQPPSTAHNYDHADYSQTLTLVHRLCMIDDEDADLVDVLADPDLCGLVSCEGPLAARLPV